MGDGGAALDGEEEEDALEGMEEEALDEDGMRWRIWGGGGVGGGVGGGRWLRACYRPVRHHQSGAPARMSRGGNSSERHITNEYPEDVPSIAPPTSAEPERAKSSSHSRREARRRERDGERSATAPAQ